MYALFLLVIGALAIPEDEAITIAVSTTRPMPPRPTTTTTTTTPFVVPTPGPWTGPGPEPTLPTFAPTTRTTSSTSMPPTTRNTTRGTRETSKASRTSTSRPVSTLNTTRGTRETSKASRTSTSRPVSTLNTTTTTSTTYEESTTIPPSTEESTEESTTTMPTMPDFTTTTTIPIIPKTDCHSIYRDQPECANECDEIYYSEEWHQFCQWYYPTFEVSVFWASKCREAFGSGTCRVNSDCVNDPVVCDRFIACDKVIAGGEECAMECGSIMTAYDWEDYCQFFDPEFVFNSPIAAAKCTFAGGYSTGCTWK